MLSKGWTWTRHRGRVCGIVIALVIFLSLTITGIWIIRNNKNVKEFPTDEEEDDAAEHQPECIHISKNMDDFWGCLVDGPRYFSQEWQQLQMQSGKEFDKSNKWGVVPLKKRPPSQNKKNKTTANKPWKRIRKRSVLSQAEFGGPYIPIDPRYVWKAKPLDYLDEEFRDNREERFNDPYYTKSISSHLYTFDVDDLNQKQPPWSYGGEFGPKNWHQLELEKFLIPVNPKIGPQDSKSTRTKLIEASLRDHWAEAFWKDPWFNYLWKNLSHHVFDIDKNLKEEQMPKHIRDFVPGDPNKTHIDTHVPNDPNSGFYSSTRFLLPPPIQLSKLKEYKEKNLLPFNFEMPYSTEQDYLKVAKKFTEYLIRLKYGLKITNDPAKKQQIIDEVSDILDHLQNYYSRYPNVNQFLGDYEFVFDYWKRDVENQTKERLSLLDKRSQYSLPLMPVVYPICQHAEPSPMNIIRKNAVRSSVKPYTLKENADTMYRMLMEFPDDGTNLLQIKLWDSNRWTESSVVLTGGAVTGSDLHFEVMFIRFGTDREAGSEHQLDGKAYAMELQLLFSYRGPDLDQPYYRTLARQQNDLFPFREKLVVMLSVLVEVKPKDKIAKPQLFEPFAQLAYKFREQDEKYPGGKNRSRGFISNQYVIRLEDFIPGGEFYMYRGGLTFPPCFSYVVWSVYNKTLEITEEQYKELKLVPATWRGDSQFVAGNIRKIEDQWVPNEHVPGITTAEQERLQQLRYSRRVLRSLNIDNTNASEVYDYDFDYDAASYHAMTIFWVVFFPLLVIGF